MAKSQLEMNSLILWALEWLCFWSMWRELFSFVKKNLQIAQNEGRVEKGDLSRRHSWNVTSAAAFKKTNKTFFNSSSEIFPFWFFWGGFFAVIVNFDLLA